MPPRNLQFRFSGNAEIGWVAYTRAGEVVASVFKRPSEEEGTGAFYADLIGFAGYLPFRGYGRTRGAAVDSALSKQAAGKESA